MDTTKVAILLCTYNGGLYIKKQIDSIVNQTYKNWVLYISDDGSKDNTLEIISSYKELILKGKIVIFEGPRAGFARNFMYILGAVQKYYDYYAFADQDDEWLNDKLTRGIEQLSQYGGPSLYCGRTELIDSSGKHLGYSPLFGKKPGFRNALVQSIAGGNTMMINSSARDLIIKTPCECEIVSHDWWFYILITACGGTVIYDQKPTILYRQHVNNIVGSNNNLAAKINRIKRVIKGDYRSWNQKNIEALGTMENYLTLGNKKIFSAYKKMKNENFLKKIFLLANIKLYRQGLADTVILTLSFLMNKA